MAGDGFVTSGQWKTARDRIRSQGS
jgi:hypothetical protein